MEITGTAASDTAAPGTAGSGTAGTENTIRPLLAAADLSPSEAETAQLAAGYPLLRVGIDALYQVSEARYADPALRFRAADTTRADWAQ
jgi:hypothetical protein